MAPIHQPQLLGHSYYCSWQTGGRQMGGATSVTW